LRGIIAAMPAEKIRHRREDVVARTVREFEALDELVRRLRAEDWARPVPRPETRDPWTVKDALAHVTYWKARTARGLRRVRHSEEERRLTITELNRLVYERWRDRPPVEVLDWHRRVHEEALAALAEAPEARISGGLHLPEWPGDFDGHSAHHRLSDIQAAL
jgi:hypothetical protein